LAADLKTANTLLSPLISLFSFRALEQGVDFDFWKFMCLTTVSGYWLLLADLAHDHPTIYPRTSFYLPDFTSFIRYTSHNNIFTNNTLFSIYTAFLSDTFLPFLNLGSKGVAKFAPLDEQNRFYVADAIIQRSYNCIKRRGKAPISALISIAVASYVLIHGAYSFILLVAGLYQKWSVPQGNSF
jgi:hypothetical protein